MRVSSYVKSKVNTLAVDSICAEFDGLRALDKVSLEVNSGEILGLIGPNGSGKTTLVNTISGHLRPVSGKVRLGNRDITGLAPRSIALMGVLRSFQVVRLFPNLSVSENIECAAVATGLSRRQARIRANDLLFEFGLLDYRHEAASSLSYGDERRVEIARALAADPAFLLLDEPAAGMNETESDILLELLARLPAQRGLGLLIIDHDMRLIMRLCHRLHVLSSGCTIGEGEVDVVRKLPAVIQAYLGSGAHA